MTGELFLAAASRQALAEEELVQQKSAERKNVRKKNHAKYCDSNHPYYHPC
jgi:hypothetical protein